MNRVPLAVLVCCGLVIAGGCLGLVGSDDDGSDDEQSVTVPDEISDGEDVQQALEATEGDLESLEGVKVEERPLSYAGTEEMTTTFAADLGIGYEATIETNESIAKAGPEVDTERQISNPDATWHYMLQLETAVELPYGPETPRELRIRGWLEDAELVYHGTEEIGGHETHHVEVVSFESTDVSSAFEQADEVDVWLDDEYWYPVQHRHVLNADSDDERIETVTHAELQFDVKIDPDRFRFDPPERVSIQDQSALSYSSDTAQQSFDDVGAAEEAVPFDIATPESVPDGYERDAVSVSDQLLTVSATVNYEHPAEPSFGVRTQVTRPNVPDDAERLAFDDRDAFVYDGGFRFGDSRVIAWTCERLWYVAIGEHPDGELQQIVVETPCQ